MTDTPAAPDGPPPVRPFADFLREQSHGQSHDELSEGLQKLVQAVLETEKAGTITYVVKVAYTKGGRRAVVVTDEIKLRTPEHDRDGSMFFADKDHNLQRNDPDQLQFKTLREIPGGGGAVVDTQTGEIKELTP